MKLPSKEIHLCQATKSH